MMHDLLEKELEVLEEIVVDEENIAEVKERFKIKDLESANWAFRKLKAIEEKKKEIEELAKKEIEPYKLEIEPYKLEIDRIEEWKDTEHKSFDSSINFFNFLLEEYYREQRMLDPKFKVSTPYGKVTSRKQQPKWNYEDDKVIEWLLKNDKDLVRVKYEPNKTDIKNKYKVVGEKVVTEDGEIVEGIAIEERDPVVKVEVV